MKNLIFSFICILVTFSCAVDGPGDMPFTITYRLLNPDSTSVITNSSDKILIEYKDRADGMIRQSYNVVIKDYFTNEHVAWAVNDTIYYFGFGYVNADSIFITCKGKIDTLVMMQFDPLEIVFNGKRTYKPNYDGEVVFLVR